MRDFYKDLLIGILFIIGLTGFISGEFIDSIYLLKILNISLMLIVKNKKPGVIVEK
jgi:hypothetical protein